MISFLLPLLDFLILKLVQNAVHNSVCTGFDMNTSYREGGIRNKAFFVLAENSFTLLAWQRGLQQEMKTGEQIVQVKQ